MWDQASGVQLVGPFRHGQWLGGVAITDDGSAIATGTLDANMVRVWDARRGTCTAEAGPVRGVFDLAFSPDARLVLAGTMTAAFWWDWKSGQIRSLSHGAGVFAVAFHPQGHTFVTGSGDGELRWWDAESLHCRSAVSAHTDRVRRAAYSPDGKIVVTVGWDSRLVFWHARTYRQIGPAVELPALD